jgi:hypothetical protein
MKSNKGFHEVKILFLQLTIVCDQNFVLLHIGDWRAFFGGRQSWNEERKREQENAYFI